MKGLGRLLPILALAACGEGNQPAQAAEAVSAAERVSTYTRLDDQACGREQVIEETGDWDRRCDGAGGYVLDWGSGDLRENLTLIKDGKSTDLEIPAKVSGGAFDSLGSMVEWRGPSDGAPDVMVVRVHVANAEGKNDGGRLAVVSLSGSPCIVAVVAPAADQSARARAIADGKLPDCLAAD